MRNTHLALGLAFFLMVVVFALSSLVFIYRPWFPKDRQETDQTVTLERGATPRAAALTLMRDHGLRGDLVNIKTNEGTVTFTIRRPGTAVNVEYTPASGEARLQTRRFNFYETLVQLHVNHGFWHEFMPANIWAFLSLGASIGLILLGASGIYLWYRRPRERTAGLILIAVGGIVPLVALILVRVGG